MQLVHALIYRKSFPLGKSRWLSAFGCGEPGSLDALLNHATRLPKVLELVDRHCSVEKPARSDGALLSNLLVLEKSLTGWLDDYYRNTGHTYSYSTARNRFAGGEKETVIDFDSFLSFNFHSLYWICQILLHSAILHLVSSRREQGCMSSDFAATSRRFADRYAALLRQSVDYVLSIESGNVARASSISLPLYVLRLWYEKSCQHEKADECVAIESSMRLANPALVWDAMLPWTFTTLMWLAE